ncbi:Methyltransferase domain-containing protein [Madurella fahalii]|uniref:Methyltransferase domain-containing protein n=1 Tax=Madurella fahalii TaxID=1157608 RepID=A0ABQ0GT59_9PEZI
MDQPNPADPSVPANLKARIKESYDAIATAYNTWTESHHPVRLRYLSKLLAEFPPRSDDAGGGGGDDKAAAMAALELGCGAGVPVTEALLARGGTHVTANDLSSTQLALARQRLGDDPARVRWVEGDMMDLAFPPASFDLVVAFYSVIHLPRHEQRVLMERVAGWLKPGGVVLLNFGAEEMEGHVIDGWLDEKGWMFWSGFGEVKTLEMLTDAGLEIVFSEVTRDETRIDGSFLWVIARRK